MQIIYDRQTLMTLFERYMHANAMHQEGHSALPVVEFFQEHPSPFPSMMTADGARAVEMLAPLAREFG
jgi:hypothetical protein